MPAMEPAGGRPRAVFPECACGQCRRRSRPDRPAPRYVAAALIGRSFDDLRAELENIPGALDEIIVRSDVIPGIHLVLLRPPGGHRRYE